MFEIKDLRIYKKSLELVKEIYRLIEKNPKLSKDFSLCDQIKRASVSIPANISEGFFRSKKQTKNYLEIASGSANEVITLLKIINLVYAIETNNLQNEFTILSKQINLFSSKF
jgi:four helix bundle protein